MSDSPYPFVPQGNILGEILEKCERLGEKRELFLALFMQYLAPIKELLSQQEIEMAPCHIDPNFGNFIKEYGTGKMYLLDLEYGRHFDPMWDLADLSCEAKFSAEKDQEMLSMKKGITLKDRLRFVLYKPVVEFYWALWAEEQIANGNQLDKIAELRKHCQRIENFKRMVASPEVREAFVALSRMTKPVMTELDVHTIAPPERRCSPR